MGRLHRKGPGRVVALLAVAVVLVVGPPANASAVPGGQVINRQTGRCLDSNAQGRVYTLPCNRGNFQNWHQDSSGQLRNNATGLCLDNNGVGSVYTRKCNGGDYQFWSSPAAYHPVTILFENFATAQRCLDGNAAGDVYTLECNWGRYQMWYVTGTGRAASSTRRCRRALRVASEAHGRPLMMSPCVRRRPCSGWRPVRCR